MGADDEAKVLTLSPEMALRLIADRGCDKASAGATGQCLIYGYRLGAKYGAFTPCPACVAALGLGLVEFPAEAKR